METSRPGPDRTAGTWDEARVRTLEDEVLALRLVLLRLVALGVAALVLAGLWLPVFSEEPDGREVTLRVATGWWTALVDPGADGEGFVVALGVGLLGLLLVALVTLWVLLAEVVGAQGTRRMSWLRGWAIGLTLVGSLVPVLLSALAAGSGPEEGGWGGVLLLAGALAAAVLVTREPTQDLWLSSRR